MLQRVWLRMSLPVLLLAVGTAVNADCRLGNWPAACDPAADNPYDWEVEPPVCDSSNPQHLFITDTAGWSQINSFNYRVFCVAPGDYRDWNNGAVLQLTTSGTPENPRWVLLHDPAAPGDTTHPVQLAPERRAIMPHFRVPGADYWNIYRMTVKGYALNSGDFINTRGMRISHMLMEEGLKGGFPLLSGNNGDYIIQYSVQRNIVPAPNGTDRSGIYVGTCDEQPCTIVRNEFINPAGDAIQVAGTSYTGGLRIDDNEMYMTDLRRTDCTTGEFDPAGLCAANEEMIVFKDPRREPAAPSYITGNIIHHSYYFDGRSCCTSGTEPAPAISIGSGGLAGALTNIVIDNNIIFDVSQGINLAHNGTNGVGNIVVRRNLLYRVDALRDGIIDQAALSTAPGHGTIEHNNIVLASVTGLVTNAAFTKDHQCNVAVDGGDVRYFGVRGSWANNHAYGKSNVRPGTGYVHEGAAQDTQNTDLCLTIMRLTTPTTFCIPNGQVTAASPFAGCTPQ